nr:SURF1 family protein [uncultured Shimia sp.]
MRRLFLPLFFGILGTIVLVSLGNWQVQRMHWKADVLTEIESRIADAPVALPQNPDPVTDRFLPVEVSGVMSEDALHVLVSVKQVGAGYRIISPFQTDSGRQIMVDRGFVKVAQKDAPHAGGAMTIVGNLHWPDEIDSYTPENDVTGNIWFSRDVPTMAAALKTEPVLVIARDTSENAPSITPLPVDSAGIPNDHLQYVVTWYGLAIVWAAMTLYYLRRMRKTKKA